MLGSFLPILVLFLIAAFIAVFVITASALLGPRKSSARKLAPYESGMEPIGAAIRRIPVKFYVVAMLFIVFDIETVFLYPWAVTFKDSGSMMFFNLAEMAVFVAILFVGYIYVWRRGAFEWG